MEFELIGWQLLHPITGEIKSDIRVVERKPKRIGGKWMRLYQNPMAYLANKKGIRGETLRVFVFLTSVVGYLNLLPSQKQIAQKMCMKQAGISRAYKQLIGIGFILKKEGNYYLSPDVCWRGTYKQMEQACREFADTRNKYLASPNL